jgi:histone H3/H4
VETESLHIAAIPKNLDPEIRKTVIARIARDISKENEP